MDVLMGWVVDFAMLLVGAFATILLLTYGVLTDTLGLDGSLMGRGLLMLSLLFATMGTVVGFVAGARYSRQAWLLTRNSALGFAITMLAANFLMVGALLDHDFTVSYVAQVGSTESPDLITMISLWSSLEGSILFWGGVLAVYTIAMVYTLRKPQYQEYAPWALHVMMAIAVFFTLLVSSIANPFAYLSPSELMMQWGAKGIPSTGPGPNPLLQNHWLMAVHPPMLYLGYVGMAAPFSLISAALLAGRLDAGWMGPVRRWMMVPWAFLSVGIVLGGWWSYAVLGWGGAWAWDPVENASFMPWLTGTAFLHSAMVLERRGLLRDWTLVLGLSSFLLTMLGTFMTRSGVFNSVHSFTQSDIGPTFLAFILITFCYSVVLLSTRSHLLDREDQSLGALSNLLDSKGRLSAKSAVSGMLGREFAIMVQNVFFTVFTFTVFLGTTYPLIVEQVWDQRISVGEPYFDRYALPVGLALVFMMGVGPALPWGRLPPNQVAKRFVPPLLFGLGCVGVIALYGMAKPIPLLAVFVCGWAFWGNFNELLGPVLQRMKTRKENPVTATMKVISRTRRRFGGHIAHYGIIMATFALALSRGYRVEDDFNLAKGETVQFQGYDITFVERIFDDKSDEHRTSEVAVFDVMRDGANLGRYEPKMNRYSKSRMADPIWSPDVRSTIASDLYFSLIELPPDGTSVQIKLIERPFMVWLWLAAPVIFLGTLIAGWPASRRKKPNADSPAPAAAGELA